MVAFIAGRVASSERWQRRRPISHLLINRQGTPVLRVASRVTDPRASYPPDPGRHSAPSSPIPWRYARANHEHGLQVLMGASMVRGGRFPLNAGNGDSATAESADILSGDYYPANLLHATPLLANAVAVCSIRFRPPRAA